jgi:hypothetical protein
MPRRQWSASFRPSQPRGQPRLPLPAWFTTGDRADAAAYLMLGVLSAGARVPVALYAFELLGIDEEVRLGICHRCHVNTPSYGG